MKIFWFSNKLFVHLKPQKWIEICKFNWIEQNFSQVKIKKSFKRWQKKVILTWGCKIFMFERNRMSAWMWKNRVESIFYTANIFKIDCWKENVSKWKRNVWFNDWRRSHYVVRNIFWQWTFRLCWRNCKSHFNVKVNLMSYWTRNLIEICWDFI